MFDQPFALLVYDRAEPCGCLEAVLGKLSVETRSAGSADDVRGLIARHQPGLVFVDLPVWNRSGSSIISLARAADPNPNVIVVGSKQDIELYVSTIERGAFTYIAPPFSCEGLRLSLSSALADVYARREVLRRSHLAGIRSLQWFTPDAPGLMDPQLASGIVNAGAGKHSA
jgi:DNA-binding NtrC family response regulator